MMEDFNSETDSDYTSYWRDWVGQALSFCPLWKSSIFERILLQCAASPAINFSHESALSARRKSATVCCLIAVTKVLYAPTVKEPESDFLYFSLWI